MPYAAQAVERRLPPCLRQCIHRTCFAAPHVHPSPSSPRVPPATSPPSYFSDELIDEIASNPRVAKYIDMPLQHISNLVLLGMNRPPREHTTTLLTKLRERIPDLVLRTTFISGEAPTIYSPSCAAWTDGLGTDLGCKARPPRPVPKSQTLGERP